MVASKRHSLYFWLIWLVISIVIASYLVYAMKSIEAGQFGPATIFLPGETTSGHHQIEENCAVCHLASFGGEALLQDACTKCHAEELERIEDSHPLKKFVDPRNADTLAKLDARFCVTCHVEHRPEMTKAMGVTLPENFCFQCHEKVGENRPSHQQLDFNSCANSGCHNFHDNRALYEDFLLKHAEKPRHLPRQQVESRNLMEFFSMTALYPSTEYPFKPLSLVQADAPLAHGSDHQINSDWLASKHAQGGVNCSACHTQTNTSTNGKEWLDKPDHTQCKGCHIGETASFSSGKHGMRLAADMSLMSPSLARQPMKAESHSELVNCHSCHSDHRYDTKYAAVDACLECHDDEHSRHYLTSPHGKLWQQEVESQAAPGSGVSCATCHMPRVWHENAEEVERILVDHNQNNTLRPNTKMLRPVCMQCHGLGFSIDALADPSLIKNNFKGLPSVHVESIDMAVEADRLHRLKRLNKTSP
ncbi:MAG: similar to NrfA-putative nitrite reduction protein [uncultured Thiotrichaceae bacterium]|uniref:nitrite reductase (cytochrome; ammonia-forming) n=1 Tax=uncultured Thiotrichaceae bacterium TaxID=298394 RepID=A0A6S6S4C0_9GAMM|nr:MAG: similar to NrfA-putative nitrite reduction protein [uncultured Thiotrichaceae bacterium]